MSGRQGQNAAGDNGRGHQQRLRAAFRKEEQTGLTFVLYARFLVLSILLIWALATARVEYALIYVLIIVAFGALGAVPLILRRYGISGLGVMAVFFTIDVILLTYILMVPGSMYPSTLTPQFNLQLPNFLYLCLFVVGMAISYSPMLVLWTGSAAMIAWSVGMFWIISLPESQAYTLAELLDSSRFSAEDRIEITSSRLFVSLTHWYNRLVFLALVTLVIAVAVWRSRRLLQQQISAEAARAGLSRYFSPNMVDRLSTADDTLQSVDKRQIAVLFVDIVGFTEMAERLGPEKVIAMLRSYHRRMAQTVFDHDGTIDKYIGDALMANFGTPEVGPHDASNALRCAFAMIDEIEAWNNKRAERGAEAIQIGIGLHFGDVVTGNIGGENHLEYAVLGDTVNLASRLERLTRALQSPIVVSGELVARVRAEDDSTETLLARLAENSETTVRGRRQPVSVWRIKEVTERGAST
ncbi:MAG: adenylate/guanylate cyclase domain-containing protein [Pseudomonadota bacterium]